jgi:hypothetical protein
VTSTRAAARLLTATLCLVVAAACAHPGPSHPPGTPPTTAPAPGAALVEWTAGGGLCPQGLCSSAARISTDGTWTATNGPTTTSGRLDAATTAELNRRVRTQVDTLATLERSDGLCPSAYDGSDITVTFHVGGRAVTVSNCDQADPANSRVIPGDNALLVYTSGLVAGLGRTPPSTDRPLVEWHSEGGHCLPGACPAQQARISEDGSWVATSGTTTTNGRLDAATTAELNRRVRTQTGTLAALERSTGGCPSAYDGRDIGFTFHVGTRTVTATNCDQRDPRNNRAVPGDNALLLYTTQVIAGLFH